MKKKTSKKGPSFTVVNFKGFEDFVSWAKETVKSNWDKDAFPTLFIVVKQGDVLLMALYPVKYEDFNEEIEICGKIAKDVNTMSDCLGYVFVDVGISLLPKNEKDWPIFEKGEYDKIETVQKRIFTISGKDNNNNEMCCGYMEEDGKLAEIDADEVQPHTDSEGNPIDLFKGIFRTNKVMYDFGDGGLIELNDGEKPYLIINIAADVRYGFRFMSKIRKDNTLEAVTYIGPLGEDGYFTAKKDIKRGDVENKEKLNEVAKEWVKFHEAFIKSNKMCKKPPIIEYHCLENMDSDLLENYMKKVGKVIKLPGN